MARLCERIIEKGEAASEDHAGIPATSEFSLSTPNLLPRVNSLVSIRPFTFLTVRRLEPGGPDEMRPEFVPQVTRASVTEVMVTPFPEVPATDPLAVPPAST